ncbi:maker443 [Drosophila busckii]|uniref:Maker443 n=1 Tax=Drosophila busckii TaxID=30019 RepID=A0A0M3QTG5_DROBS|nr:maker443 [Drosophila busckii]
MDLLSRNKIMR